MGETTYFLIADVANATGVTTKNIRQWLQRRVLIASDSIWPAGASTPRLFDESTAIEVAITGRLVEHGLPPQRAAQAAQKFVYMGTSAWGHVGDDAPSAPERYAGEEFGAGGTALMIQGDADRVVRKADLTLPELMRHTPATVVDLDGVVRGVRAQLHATKARSLDTTQPSANPNISDDR